MILWVFLNGDVCVNSLPFSHTICYLQIGTVLSSFPIFLALSLFLAFVAKARISSSMFNKGDESEHPCLYPGLKGERYSIFHQ